MIDCQLPIGTGELNLYPKLTRIPSAGWLPQFCGGTWQAADPQVKGTPLQISTPCTVEQTGAGVGLQANAGEFDTRFVPSM